MDCHAVFTISILMVTAGSTCLLLTAAFKVLLVVPNVFVYRRASVFYHQCNKVNKLPLFLSQSIIAYV